VLSLIDLEPYRCFGGLDLAAVHDLTAFVLAWPVGDLVYAHPWFWLPEENLAERSKRDNVRYDLWARDGYLELTPGSTTDWRYATAKIIRLREKYNIAEIGFDRWGARDVTAALEEAGFLVTDIGQGYASMNAPCKRLEELVMSGKLIHNGHPILRWNIDCCAVSSDPAGNIKPVKPPVRRSSKRIDGVVALSMAINCVMAAPPEPCPLSLTQGFITL
jgi:phage terminase large subunit-like protein